jgi:hypothetical protein
VEKSSCYVQASNFVSMQKCMSGHTLQYKTISEKKLIFCEGCLRIIKEDEAFLCEKDNYFFCVECAKDKPRDFVGDARAIAKS